jgi:hypothetical protein
MSDVGGASNENSKGDSENQNFLQRVETRIMTKKRLGTSGVSSVGSVGSKDLRRRDSGIRFLAMAGTAGTGAGGRRDGESMSRVEGTGDETGGEGCTSEVSTRAGTGKGEHRMSGGEGSGMKGTSSVSSRMGEGERTSSEAEGTLIARLESESGRGGEWGGDVDTVGESKVSKYEKL